MSKFEWMELETLSNDIAHSESRLDAARHQEPRSGQATSAGDC